VHAHACKIKIFLTSFESNDDAFEEFNSNAIGSSIPSLSQNNVVCVFIWAADCFLQEYLLLFEESFWLLESNATTV
jgi:hypothetical protein